MPYARQKGLVLSWLQKQDSDKDKSRTAAGREFQAVGPQTTKLHDPYRLLIIRYLSNACMLDVY